MKKRLFHKGAVFSLCLIMLFSMTGCQILGTEMVDLLIIQGIGIDKSKNGYKVTVEAINNPKNSFLSGNSTSESVAKIYVSYGVSIAEALDNVVRVSGKKPLYSHNRILIIGQETVKDGITSILDFFIREYNAKSAVYIAIAKNMTAEKIISTDMGKDIIVSQVLESVLKDSNENGKAFRMRLFELVNSTLDQTKALYIPYVVLDEDEKEEENALTLHGTAVFSKKNDLIGYLSETETLGAMLLNDQMKKGIININMDGERIVVLRIESTKTKTKVYYENGRVHAEINISMLCNIKEINSTKINNISEEVLKQIKKLAGERIISISASAINAARNELRADIFSLGRRLWITDSAAFGLVKDNWTDAFCNSDIEVTAKVTIKRTGEEAIF
ncbi:MAG: Spore germination protein B3 precursor [Firmicutes bacterium ADurb.Bin300]|nr:MAG: Spore germination protein B3 precursor [Firmicutes bacterium ADurb.Bin300]HOD01776.1 Ger(x)C family spore germination protein [Clostridiales bacterium]